MAPLPPPDPLTAADPPAGAPPLTELMLPGAEGIGLRCLVAGEGPLVVLLHGFPDAPESWRFQQPALAAAGYRVVAPALRGYGGSGRPAPVAAYAVDRVAADIAALIGAEGGRAALVAGHDWGGVVAWHLAAHHPSLVERLAVLNAPHPAAFARELRRPDQMARSLYALFFQLPWLPEALLRRRDYALVRRSVSRAVRRPGAFSAADWPAVRAALSPPGALSAALAYYRATGRSTARALLRRGRVRAVAGDPRPIAAPTLLLWGDRDPFLTTRFTTGLEPWVPHLTVRHLPEAGHWVHWDGAEEVTAELLYWCAADLP